MLLLELLPEGLGRALFPQISTNGMMRVEEILIELLPSGLEISMHEHQDHASHEF